MATDAEIELTDLLESYPGQMTPGFQTLISAKKEFNENASTLNEPLPKGRGQYFKHQKFTHRLLRAYDDLMITSQTGTGKSCEILGFTEWVNRERLKASIDPSSADEKLAHFKRIIVIFRGKTLINEFNNQLICKCSDGHYESEALGTNEVDEFGEPIESSKIRPKTIVSRAGYELTTYWTFAQKISREYPNTPAGNEQLAEDFADTVFWIDEAHNLLIKQSELRNKKTIGDKKLVYESLWRIFHLARRSKRILSTATPMINEPSDIGSLMNLLLPMDGDMPLNYDYINAPSNDLRVLFPDLPFDHRTATRDQIGPYFSAQFPSNYDFESATLEDLEPRFRGRIGFIRGAESGAIVQEQTNPDFQILSTFVSNSPEIEYQSILYQSNMSEFQNEAYQRAVELTRREREGPRAAEISASNFVFPDGEWGHGLAAEHKAELKRHRTEIRQERRRVRLNLRAGSSGLPEDENETPEDEAQLLEGGIIPGITLLPDEDTQEGSAFIKYVVSTGDAYEATPEFSEWLTNLDNIRTLSAKYATIVDICMNEPGNAFIYGPDIIGSGIATLALCFEGMGFVRYTERTSIFEPKVVGAAKSYCSNAEENSDLRTVRIAPARRYAFLTNKLQPNQIHSMMEAMNSYENRHGDYIKVFISSGVGKEGININNVLQIHLAAPEWNESNIYQAMSRGIRATSHDDLLQEERDRIAREEPDRDPDTATVAIKVYKHVAIDQFGYGVDKYMYELAERKDRRIRRIFRMMKQCAVGCQVHRARNVRGTDLDGSAACDYDICQYPCVDPPPETDDYSTYDVLYAGDVIFDAINALHNIYSQYNALNFAEIVARVPDLRSKYLIMALEYIISHKIALRDRFGYTAYLREDNGYFYLDRSYPTGLPSAYAMAYYTEGIIGIKQESLAGIVVHLEAQEYADLLAELQTMDPQDPQFITRLNNLSVQGQIVVVEAAILQAVQDGPTPFTNAIRTHFAGMIFEIHDPVTELHKFQMNMTQQNRQRGRKPKPENKNKIKRVKNPQNDRDQITYDTNTERVFLHNLYSQIGNQTGYGNVARYNKAEGLRRILKPSEIESGWRDLNANELHVYNIFIQLEIANRYQAYEAQGLYGIILSDQSFRIKDRSREKPGAKNSGRDNPTGKICNTWERQDLIDIMWEIGVPVSDFMPESYKTPTALVDALRRRKIKKSVPELMKWPLDKLVYYVKLYANKNYTRDRMCDLIQKHLDAAGRIFKTQQ